jgi:hypothetical protein
LSNCHLFIFVGLGFELRASCLQKQILYCLSHTSSPFYSGSFEDGVSQTVCWAWTLILRISASQVERITVVFFFFPRLWWHWGLDSVPLTWHVLYHLSHLTSPRTQQLSFIVINLYNIYFFFFFFFFFLRQPRLVLNL